MTVPTRTILPPILTAAAIIAASSGRHHHCNAFTARGHGVFSHGRVVLLLPPTTSLSQLTRTYATSSTNVNAAVPPTTVGNLHGQGSCFLPLLQNDEDYIAPRIVQVRSSSSSSSIFLHSLFRPLIRVCAPLEHEQAYYHMKPMINYRI